MNDKVEILFIKQTIVNYFIVLYKDDSVKYAFAFCFQSNRQVTALALLVMMEKKILVTNF